MAIGIKAGDVVGGKYVVVQNIGSGGQASVYQATVGQTAQLVALKVALKALTPDLRQRWVREAESAQKVRSPHVVTVLDSGVEGDIPWVAWEFLEGRNLHEFIEANGRFELDRASIVLRQIFVGIRDLHFKGIVHCDLSPKNVFLAGSEPLVKLLDFGIAKILGESMAGSTTFVAGSPLWMSPEQMRGREGVGGQADVWAFGLLAFYILVGKPYWRVVDNLPAYVAQVLHEPRKHASVRAAELGVNLQVPDQFNEWFARCTSLDSGARYQSISEAWRAYQEVYDFGLDATTQRASKTVERASEPGHRASLRIGVTMTMVAAGAFVAALGFRYVSGQSDKIGEKTKTVASARLQIAPPSSATPTSSTVLSSVLAEAADIGLFAECAETTLYIPATRNSTRADGFCVDEKEVSVGSFRKCVPHVSNKARHVGWDLSPEP